MFRSPLHMGRSVAVTATDGAGRTSWHWAYVTAIYSAGTLNTHCRGQPSQSCLHLRVMGLRSSVMSARAVYKPWCETLFSGGSSSSSGSNTVSSSRSGSSSIPRGSTIGSSSWKAMFGDWGFGKQQTNNNSQIVLLIVLLPERPQPIIRQIHVTKSNATSLNHTWRHDIKCDVAGSNVISV